MDQLEFLDRIKRLVIIAMFSDDELMKRLVLKGGNLLDVVLRLSSRGSIDLDFSIEGVFEDVPAFERAVSAALTRTLADEGYVVST